MTTKGRRRVAIARAMDLVRLVCRVQGGHHQDYRNELGFTKGEFQTALRYAIEDGMVKQTGRRRGARLYPTDKASLRMTERPKDAIEASRSAMVELNRFSDKPCSYCNVADVDPLMVRANENGDFDFEDEFNRNSAIRQSFHLCQRCFEHRMPTHAKFYQDTEWMDKYPQWDAQLDMGHQQVFRFVKWCYSPDIDGKTSLFARVVPLDNEGEEYGAPEVHINFTFFKDDGRATFGRGYRFMHRLFSHPNQLWGRKIVVSRERHKVRRSGGAGWFWSWTPYPRIPLHIKRTMELDDETYTNEYDDGYAGIPEDSTLPQHHIHSVVAEGDFTVIKIRKGFDTYKQRFRDLHDAVLAFLAGELSLVELEDKMQEE